MNFNRHLSARGLLAAAACIAAFEGLRTAAYLDPVGIPTICFGETKGVKMGHTATPEQCKEMLGNRVVEFDNAVVRCIGYAPAPGPRAAFVSLAYNIGEPKFCGSTLARLARDGEIEQACQQLDRWVYAKGVVLPGLVKRRAEEKQLCLSSIS